MLLVSYEFQFIWFTYFTTPFILYLMYKMVLLCVMLKHSFSNLNEILLPLEKFIFFSSLHASRSYFSFKFDSQFAHFFHIFFIILFTWIFFKFSFSYVFSSFFFFFFNLFDFGWWWLGGLLYWMIIYTHIRCAMLDKISILWWWWWW